MDLVALIGGIIFAILVAFHKLWIGVLIGVVCVGLFLLIRYLEDRDSPTNENVLNPAIQDMLRKQR